MAQESGIEWTDATWNPVTGCSKISAGCANCYAERMARRLQAMRVPAYEQGFEVTLQPQVMDAPSNWKTPKRIFVNSMSDLFHDEVPFSYIVSVFEVIRKNPHHQFQILTKRSSRLRQLSGPLIQELGCWPDNAWIGVSVENAAAKFRIDDLAHVEAAVRFLSLEPLIGALGRLPLKGVHWVIVGGESGPRARPMNPEWVDEIQRQCISQHVPFFFKQWGGVNKKKTGRLLHNRTWDEFPVATVVSGAL